MRRLHLWQVMGLVVAVALFFAEIRLRVVLWDPISYLVLLTVSGSLGMYVASRMNRRWWDGFLMGFVLGPVGLALACFLLAPATNGLPRRVRSCGSSPVEGIATDGPQ